MSEAQSHLESAAMSGDRSVRPSPGERMYAVGRLQVRSERHGTDHVVAVSGELDLATAQGVEDALKAAETSDADRVILDLSALEFIDSTGVQLVILANARSQVDGCRLRLLRGPAQVQRVFELIGVADTLPFAD